MIELTRLNGNPLFVNCDLIKWAESAPDTMLTLVNGEKVLVRESCAEVADRIVQQRARLLAEVVKRVPGGGTLLHQLLGVHLAPSQASSSLAPGSGSPPPHPEGSASG